MIVYVDLETTGLDPESDYITQIAMIVESDGVEDSLDILINPPAFPPNYDLEAGRITGLSRQKLEDNGMSFLEAYEEVILFLSKYIKARSKKKKGHLCGKNVNFDKAFLDVFFQQSGSRLYEWFYPIVIDIDCIVAYLSSTGEVILPNNRLGGYAEGLGVKLTDAHNAMADIKATKEIFEKSIKILRGENVK